MSSLDDLLLGFTKDWRNPVGVAVVAAILFVAVLFSEHTRLMLQSLRRNLLRTALMALAIFTMVIMVTMIWSVLAFLDAATESKSKNLKGLVTERFQAPSMMPYAYASTLAEGAPRNKTDYRINASRDAMPWSFYGGTLDPGKLTRENILFFFAMEPSKLVSYDAQGRFTTMMDDVEDLTDKEKHRLAAAAKEMEKYPYKVLIGPDRLTALNKKVGERIKVTSLNYKDIDLEFEIMGEMPSGRYGQSAVMNYVYLDEALRKYNQGKPKDQQHRMTEKSLALMFLRFPDTATFEKVAQQIHTSPLYKSPAVKCETLSSGVASFLDAYRDLLFGMRWLMAPALIASMALVIAVAISISVRERRTEMAVMKVLGFSPNQLLILVLGEALLIGCLTGLASAWLTKYIVNDLVEGFSLPIGFFGIFMVAKAAPWWGLTIGAVTALAGSIVPAWSARSVKVSEVFSKVA
jgi:putative ABC transport system permease protein